MAGMNQTIQAAQGGQMPNIMPQQQQEWQPQQQDQQKPWMQRHPWQSMTGIGAMYGLQDLMTGGAGLFGKPEQTQQVPKFPPQIMNLLMQMGPDIWKQLMGNQFDFQPVEDLARQNFSSQTLPSLMGRFNMGNNRASSNQFGAFNNAGQGLDAQLAAMRQGFGQQRQSMLASLMPTAMTSPFENVFHERQPGSIESIAKFGASLIPKAFGFGGK